MREFEVETTPDVAFAEHDGVTLLGDFYRPKGLAKAPVLVGIHGGGWQVGDRKFYKNWGSYLAGHGYAVFAIEYRLMKPGMTTWPGVVNDCKAAVQFVRARAAEFGLDTNRIGMIGDFGGRAFVGARGIGRQGAAILWRIQRRPLCFDPVRRQTGDRVLRGL